MMRYAALVSAGVAVIVIAFMSNTALAQGGPPPGAGGGITTLSDLGCGPNQIARKNVADEWECSDELTANEAATAAAQATGNGAQTAADAAQATANSAQTAADAAQATADGAQTTADAAQSTANDANSRVGILEGQNLGSRLSAIEGQNLNNRVSDLETRLEELIARLFKTVFVTSKTFQGDLITEAEQLTGTVATSGLEGGDLICQNLATDAGLGGNYKAWLADSSGSPSTRFARSTVPYVRTDGVKVADDWNDLVNCSNPSCLQAPINVDEFGFPPSAAPVFSNVLPDGTTWFPDTCDNWTFVGVFELGQPFVARWGANVNTDITWTRAGSGFCASSFPLYCFGQ